MIHVLWDDAHFWGLMALRALTAWGLPHRLVRGTEIAQGVLSGNPGGLLLVPGGNARTKAQALGPGGMDAVRSFVADGGSYLGFCGGAGLALTGKNPEANLGLCPWQRRPFDDRMQHFLSGHVHVTLRRDHDLVPASLGPAALVPVWWPAQMEEAEDEGVEILATYADPGPDFWVADLALKTLPPGTMTEWEDLYDIHLRPDFLRGRPCVVAGTHGQGRYVLSYAHLETPASPLANTWLAHLLGRLTGCDPARPPLPAWDPGGLDPRWQDESLLAARTLLEEVVRTGLEHFLLFWRTPWLLGWRRGIPGAALNSLYTLVCEALATGPAGSGPDQEGRSAEAWWSEQAKVFRDDLELFIAGLRSYLLAERLAMTVFQCESSLPGLRQRREALFGSPPGTGGMHLGLLRTLEELVYRLRRDDAPSSPSFQ